MNDQKLTPEEVGRIQESAAHWRTYFAEPCHGDCNDEECPGPGHVFDDYKIAIEFIDASTRLGADWLRAEKERGEFRAALKKIRGALDEFNSVRQSLNPPDWAYRVGTMFAQISEALRESGEGERDAAQPDPA